MTRFTLCSRWKRTRLGAGIQYLSCHIKSLPPSSFHGSLELNPRSSPAPLEVYLTYQHPPIFTTWVKGMVSWGQGTSYKMPKLSSYPHPDSWTGPGRFSNGGDILTPGAIFGGHETNTTAIFRVEAREAAQYPIRHTAAPTAKNNPAQYVSHSKLEKPWSGVRPSHWYVWKALQVILMRATGLIKRSAISLGELESFRWSLHNRPAVIKSSIAAAKLNPELRVLQALTYPFRLGQPTVYFSQTKGIPRIWDISVVRLAPI